MIEIILGIGVASFIVYAAFSIAYIVGLKRAITSVEKFVRNSEGNVTETLDGLKGTVEHVRKITADVSAVTEEVRQLSRTVASLDKAIRDIYGYFKHDLSSTAEANIAGLKAGITTGMTTLIKNLHERSNDHERERDK